MEEILELDVKRVDGVTMVRPTGEIDMATAPRLSACLSSLTGRVVVQLDEVTFLDSSGISVLVGAHHRLESDHGELVIRRPNPIVRRTLELTGLGEWIDG
jgi:anti-sigma B factor antagonist